MWGVWGLLLFDVTISILLKKWHFLSPDMLNRSSQPNCFLHWRKEIKGKRKLTRLNIAENGEPEVDRASVHHDVGAEVVENGRHHDRASVHHDRASVHHHDRG